MSEVISFIPRFIEKRCSYNPLRELFRKHTVVSVGDELGAFYLGKWATLPDEEYENSNYTDDSPFYPWKKRSLYEANVAYMEFVYAAYEEGVRDIIIDMSPAMQAGIDEGLEIYADTCKQHSAEILFRALLRSDIATPMDAVVQMAGSLGMKVHALNNCLTGIATLFREAKGIDEVPSSLDFQGKLDHYMAVGFEKDRTTLRHLLRREPTMLEIATMLKQIERRLSDKKQFIEKMIFDENPTLLAIEEAVGDKPILGFFQNARLFRSSNDLDDGLRSIYGNENVARLSMIPLEDKNYPKYPQYNFRYSVKECTVAMTEEHVRNQQKIKVSARV